jgi:hypothetical protein
MVRAKYILDASSGRPSSRFHLCGREIHAAEANPNSYPGKYGLGYKFLLHGLVLKFVSKRRLECGARRPWDPQD